MESPQQTTSELLDVVDETDIVISKKPRINIHRDGDLHREIHVWMFDQEGNVLFQKRGDAKSSAGLLDATVGGHVDSGEDYIASALREIKEETGLIVDRDSIIFLKKYHGTSHNKEKNTTNNFFRSVYIYKYPISIEILRKEEGEVGMDFIAISQVQFQNLEKTDTSRFVRFITTEEIPIILSYIRSSN